MKSYSMISHSVDYDQIAHTYHQRHRANPMPGVAGALSALAREIGARQALEAGCGTGRWLAELKPIVPHVFGLDLSAGILAHARARAEGALLTRGRARHLPFPSASFDLVVCVNALHHFDEPRAFIAEARRTLRPGGAFATIGSDPHSGRDSWYMFDYFEGTRQTDLQRFASTGALVDWLIGAGFKRAERRVAEEIRAEFHGREVSDNPFLAKNSTSQLVLLSDEAYAAGLARIHAALATAEAQGRDLVFRDEISLMLVIGWLD